MVGSSKSRSITLLAVLIALTTALGFVVKIPIGTGIFTLVDLMIYLVAFVYGKKRGMIVGGISAMLIDLLSGYPQYSLFSLVIHGGQGFVAGAVLSEQTTLQRVKGVICGSIVMIAGYFVADTILVGLGGAIADMISTNILQSVIGGVGSLILYPMINPVVKRMEA